MEAKERALWSSGIGIVVIGVAVAVATIVVVRLTKLPAEPWLYIGLVIGIMSALGGFGLAFMRARELSE